MKLQTTLKVAALAALVALSGTAPAQDMKFFRIGTS